MAKQLKPQPLQQLEYSNDIQLREKSQAPNSTIEYFAVAKDSKAGDTKIIVVGYNTTKNTTFSTATRPPTITAGKIDQKEATGDKPEDSQDNKKQDLENKKFDCYIIKNTEIYTTSFEVTNRNTDQRIVLDFIGNLFYMYYGKKVLFIDFIGKTYTPMEFNNIIDSIQEQKSDTKTQKQKGFNIFLNNDDEKFINFTKKPCNVLHKPYKKICKELCKQKMCKNICNTTLRIAGDTKPEYYAYIYNKEGKRFLKYGNINDLMQEVAEPVGDVEPVEVAKLVKDPKKVEVVEPVEGGDVNGFMPLYDQYVLFQV